MSGTRKPNNVRQREPLRVPTHWNTEDRAFVIQANEQLDDVYARLGRLSKHLETVDTQIEQLNVGLSVVDGKVCITYNT